MALLLQRRALYSRDLWFDVLGSILLLPLVNEEADAPQEEEEGSKDTVRDLALDGVVRKHEAETTIDGTKEEHHASSPAVGDTPDSAFLVLSEDEMMDKTTDGLEKEDSNHDNADDWVTIGYNPLNTRWVSNV